MSSVRLKIEVLSTFLHIIIGKIVCEASPGRSLIKEVCEATRDRSLRKVREAIPDRSISVSSLIINYYASSHLLEQ